MKLTAETALRILGELGEFEGEQDTRNVYDFTVTYPFNSHSAATFRFLKNHYAILIDNNADSDEEYIREQLDHPLGDFIYNPQMDDIAHDYKGKKVYVIKREEGGERLDILLTERNPEYSRASWQEFIRQGYVTVAGEVETSPAQRVSKKVEIQTEIPQYDFSDQALPVIYQDDDMIVVDKPAGMLAHAKGAVHDEFTVADFLARYTSWNSDTNRPGIVHRLDRGTSGVIIGARTAEAGKHLQKQFADRKAKKVYYAVVSGVPSRPEALIDVPIGRNPKRPSEFRPSVQGKSAQTAYRVVETRQNKSLIELRPTTGRTHQLRVHMQHIGHPIVGDEVYGGEAHERMLLHATSLEITRPDRVRDTFHVDTPESFWGE